MSPGNLGFQSLQEDSKQKLVSYLREIGVSFQSLQEDSKRRHRQLRPAELLRFQSLQEDSKPVRAQRRHDKARVSNPYRKILSYCREYGYLRRNLVSNPYRKILSWNRGEQMPDSFTRFQSLQEDSKLAGKQLAAW